jgi:hypothetical protein
MALNSTHPDYACRLADWQLMRHAYEGERTVKEQGVMYLPATPGQILDGMNVGEKGRLAYDAYKMRAVFPDFVSDAVESFIGIMHMKDATIELPDGMADMLEKATVNGESLQALLRRINEQQLVTGRLGLLLDLPEIPDPAKPLPYIALYVGEAIRNWDDSDDHTGVNALNMVVLDESVNMRDTDFEWKRHERYRVLELVHPLAHTSATDGEEADAALPAEPAPAAPPVYAQGVFDVTAGGTGSYSQTSLVPPMLRGKMLEQIPFVIINSKDILTQPDNPPLLGLGRIAMTVYRGEADYRQTLFMTGQDMLVVIGGIQTRDEGETRVGAGAKLEVDIGGDAKYIGVEGTGLEEQRMALENDTKRAEAKTGTLISPSAGKQESGDALTTRLAAQTASLGQIARTGALGLENLLKIAAEWMGQDPKKVKVAANTEFKPVLLTGQEVTQLMAARTMGAPLSLESLHGVFVDRGLTKMTFEDEMDVIAEEDAGRAARVAALPQPPAPPAPAPAPGEPTPAPAPAPAPAGGAA